MTFDDILRMLSFILSESVATYVLGEIFRAFLKTLWISVSPFMSIRGLFLILVEPILDGI